MIQLSEELTGAGCRRTDVGHREGSWNWTGMHNKRILLVVVLIAAFACAAAPWRPDPEEPVTPLTLYGNVDMREVDLGFRLPGRLASMAFHEGE